jgi:hypothetical protein
MNPYVALTATELRRIKLARLAAGAIVVLSILAATFIPIPNKLPSTVLNSEWVFRGLVFVACPVGISVVWVIVASILAGEPLQKLGLGPFSVEGRVKEAAIEIAEGGSALKSARKSPSESPEFAAAMSRFDESISHLEREGWIGDSNGQDDENKQRLTQGKVQRVVENE